MCVFITNCVKKILARTKTERKFRILVVGGTGMIGRQICQALIRHGCIEEENLIVCRSQGLLHDFPPTIICTDSLESAIEEYHPRLILLACTGPQIESIASTLKSLLRPTIVVCSIASGIKIGRLKILLGVAHPIKAICYENIHEDDKLKQLATAMWHSNEDILGEFEQALYNQACLLGVNVTEASNVSKVFTRGRVTQESSDPLAVFQNYFVDTVNSFV